MCVLGRTRGIMTCVMLVSVGVSFVMMNILYSKEACTYNQMFLCAHRLSLYLYTVRTVCTRTHVHVYQYTCMRVRVRVHYVLCVILDTLCVAYDTYRVVYVTYSVYSSRDVCIRYVMCVHRPYCVYTTIRVPPPSTRSLSLPLVVRTEKFSSQHTEIEYGSKNKHTEIACRNLQHLNRPESSVTMCRSYLKHIYTLGVKIFAGLFGYTIGVDDRIASLVVNYCQLRSCTRLV